MQGGFGLPVFLWGALENLLAMALAWLLCAANVGTFYESSTTSDIETLSESIAVILPKGIFLLGN